MIEDRSTIINKYLIISVCVSIFSIELNNTDVLCSDGNKTINEILWYIRYPKIHI